MGSVSDRTPDEPPDVPLGDVMGDVPLFREIQRVMLASNGPINWELARQVGIAVASWGTEDPVPGEEERAALADTVRAAELAVADFTGLPTPSDVATVEAFRRAQWVEANVHGLKELLEPIAAKLGSALGEAQGMAPMPDPGGGQGAELMEMLLQRMAPLLMGAQVGSVLGYLGQRVLGQFDLAVPRPQPSLYFVVPNIAAFERDWSLPPVEFRAWVALHEVTHRFEFSRAWVRPHFLHLVRDLVEHAELDMAGLQRRMEELDMNDPESMSMAFEGMGSFFGDTVDDEQRLRVNRVQAFMAAAEGYGDHIMKTLGAKMLPAYRQIQEALNRFHEGRPGDLALNRLLGLEMKAEQYRLGERFCSVVADLTGEATLARIWESPEALPSMPELEEPSLWLARMA